MEILVETAFETVKISAIILILMIIVEYIEIVFNEKLKKFFSKGKFSQIFLATLFGSFPGCIGTFVVDSFYMSGIIGFGAINSALIATSGDEAFILIGMAFKGDSPITLSSLIILFSSLFLFGILGGYLAILYKKIFKIKLCKKCTIVHEEEDKSKPKFSHFFTDHVFKHIIKNHILKLAVWLFLSIFFITLMDNTFNMKEILTHNKPLLLVLGAFVGILPISGPNLLFVSLFSQGMIPFSVLLANSIVQDGHGSLPLLSFSVNDTIKIKVFNFLFGLTVGAIILIIGF